MQIEPRDDRWTELQQEVERQAAELGVSGEPSVRVFLGTPEKNFQGDLVLIVESDVQQWERAIASGMALLASRSIALAYQARVVLEVAGLMSLADQRELALRSLLIKGPWIDGSEREATALQLSLATLAARNELPRIAFQILQQVMKPESDPRGHLRGFSLPSSPHTDGSVIQNLCIEAAHTFADVAQISRPDTELSDEELLQQLVEGDDPQAAENLKKRHGQQMYAFATKLLRSREAAEGILDSVFLQARRTASSFHRRNTVRAWLLSIVRDLAIDELRRVKRTALTPQEEQTATGESMETFRPRADESAIGFEELTSDERRRLLEQIIESLPQEIAGPLLLRYRDGLSYEEMAALTGERAGTLQARVTRAVPRLRAELTRRLKDKPHDD